MIYNELKETLNFENENAINIAYSSSYLTYPAHWHTFIELAMPLHDGYKVSINNKEYLLHRKEIIIMHPGEIHSTEAKEENNTLILQFDPNLLTGIKDFYRNYSILQSIRLIRAEELDIHTQLVSLLLEMKNIYYSKIHFKEAILYTKLIEFYTILGNKYVYSTNRFPDVVQKKQDEYRKILIRVCNYINENITMDLSLETIATYAGFSKFHFSRLFRQFTNCSLPDYITAQKIKKAESLLLNPDLSITEIALQSGFNSLSTFNRAFKEAKKLSPTEFKKLYYAPKVER